MRGFSSTVGSSRPCGQLSRSAGRAFPPSVHRLLCRRSASLLFGGARCGQEDRTLTPISKKAWRRYFVFFLFQKNRFGRRRPRTATGLYTVLYTQCTGARCDKYRSTLTSILQPEFPKSLRYRGLVRVTWRAPLPGGGSAGRPWRRGPYLENSSPFCFFAPSATMQMRDGCGTACGRLRRALDRSIFLEGEPLRWEALVWRGIGLTFCRLMKGRICIETGCCCLWANGGFGMGRRTYFLILLLLITIISCLPFLRRRVRISVDVSDCMRSWLQVRWVIGDCSRRRSSSLEVDGDTRSDIYREGEAHVISLVPTPI